MSVIQDRHGTYYVQRKVPERLQETVARVLNDDKPRRVFLKKSLGTKNLKEANVAAVHVPELSVVNSGTAKAVSSKVGRFTLPLVSSAHNLPCRKMALYFPFGVVV